MVTKPRQNRAERAPVVGHDSRGGGRAPARLLAAATAASLAAAAGPGHAENDNATLTVKPVLCVTDRREEGCALSITVSWQSENEGDYCLHSDLADEPIRCWEGAAAGTITEERVVRKTFSYWLTSGGHAKLAEATLELLTTESDDRRRNRRRRHVWDIL